MAQPQKDVCTAPYFCGMKAPMFVKHQPKKNKTVCLLSTMHFSADVGETSNENLTRFCFPTKPNLM